MSFFGAKGPVCYCQSCGKTVSLNEKFCVGCGALLGDIQCPKCNNTGPPIDFKEGCPKCLYLNAKGNTSSGIIRVDTLIKAYGKDKGSQESELPLSSKNKNRSYVEKNEPFPTVFFTNLLMLVLLSFGILGGLWWLSQ